MYNSYETADFSTRDGITGSGYCPDATGQCYVSFNGQSFDSPNYKVVDTDYTHYTIIYSCGIKQHVWILTREPVISDAEYEVLLEIAVKKLPYMNFAELNTRDYQGPNCVYPPLPAESFLQ